MKSGLRQVNDMINAIGVLETNSISQGIEIADAMLKVAQVELLESKPVCPGKYMTIVFGDVESVESSLRIGREKAGSYYVDDIVIPNVHPQVVHAVAGIPEETDIHAVGILEFFSIAGSIYGADAAVKAADVSIITMRLGIAIGGKSYFIVTGDVAAVRSAVEAGKQTATEHGLLFNHNIIPSPHKALIQKLVV